MTEVAGDFYEFLRWIEYRAGFLVADVSGHGVPAALIASMIKVATQSVVHSLTILPNCCAGSERFCQDNCTASVSAAYLWIDTENWHRTLLGRRTPSAFMLARRQRFSSRASKATASSSAFPSDARLSGMRHSVRSGDRFLLYTDGFTNPRTPPANPSAITAGAGSS